MVKTRYSRTAFIRREEEADYALRAGCCPVPDAERGGGGGEGGAGVEDGGVAVLVFDEGGGAVVEEGGGVGGVCGGEGYVGGAGGVGDCGVAWGLDGGAAGVFGVGCWDDGGEGGCGEDEGCDEKGEDALIYGVDHGVSTMVCICYIECVIDDSEEISCLMLKTRER